MKVVLTTGRIRSVSVGKKFVCERKKIRFYSKPLFVYTWLYSTAKCLISWSLPSFVISRFFPI